MRFVCFCIVLLLVLTGAQAQSPKHEIIRDDNKGSFSNYDFFVPGLQRDTAKVIQAAKALVSQYCSDKQCNQVYFWRDKEAERLWMYKRDNIALDRYDYDKNRWLATENKWKKKHWKKVCEGLIAVYSGYQMSDLEFDPFIDSEYRKYGGKLKRIRPATVPLVWTPASNLDKEAQAKEIEDKGGGGTVLLIAGIILFAGFYLYRKAINKNTTKPRPKK